MHVTIVRVQVKPEHIQNFIEASRLNHTGSMREAGNRRFDVLQRPDDPTEFVLYEAYASAEDAAAHKHTPHYLAPSARGERFFGKSAIAPSLARGPCLDPIGNGRR